MTTMADVAAMAGVSGATVSHVLNGTRFVSDETRSRVEAAIEQTGYRHNSLARALAAGRTRTIGMCVPILRNPYIGSLVNAIETAASSAGYTLVIGDSLDDVAAEMRAVNGFLERRVDGIIIAPGPKSRDTTIPPILASRTPLVLVDRREALVACDQITSDNVEPTRELTRHLLDHGHRRIAVLRGAPLVRSKDKRVEGVRRAFRDRGLGTDDRLVLVANNIADDAERAFGRLLAAGSRPDAILSLNNAMTIGAMRAIRSAGLRVPSDIALASFDDFEWSDLFDPRLTAVEQDIAGLGRGAVQLLISRVADPDLAPRALRVATRLNVRESCGCIGDDARRMRRASRPTHP